MAELKIKISEKDRKILEELVQENAPDPLSMATNVPEMSGTL